MWSGTGTAQSCTRAFQMSINLWSLKRACALYFHHPRRLHEHQGFEATENMPLPDLLLALRMLHTTIAACVLKVATRLVDNVFLKS
mmetsp:Transcript_126035/g.368272  ORF Transcript_126035/g.368272 Transcript_126035/m.368272 type:complete len:86 (-) Transcript_126035:199-456(-)